MLIPKLIALLGIGRDDLRLIHVDSSFRIASQLEQAMLGDTERVIPTAVVGSAGTVNTGAIDMLDGIAPTAAHFRVWTIKTSP
jgi:aromatic-L-amino-acid/L-tryptophan decarboxylase